MRRNVAGGLSRSTAGPNDIDHSVTRTPARPTAAVPTTRPVRHSLPLALLLVSLAGSAPARACPCQSGDPTTLGSSWGLAGSGRIRLGLESRWMMEGYGLSGRDRAEVNDLRLEPSVAWAPTDGVLLSLVVPLAYRRVARENLSLEEHVAPADPELRLRVTLLGREPGARDLLGASLAVDVPLMIAPTSSQGDAVRMESMIGSGSADASVGLWYFHRDRDLDVLASAGWRFPTEGFAAMRMGPAFDAMATLQWRVVRELSLRLGADTRLEVPGTMHGARMAGTGGVFVRAVPEVVLVPVRELAITIGARLPVYQALNDGRTLGPTIAVSLVGEL